MHVHTHRHGSPLFSNYTIPNIENAEEEKEELWYKLSWSNNTLMFLLD